MGVASFSSFTEFHESFHLLRSTSMEASFHANSSSFHGIKPFMYFDVLPWKLELGQLPCRYLQLRVGVGVRVSLVEAAGCL